jgi:uncharacterized repeat protein (TIGR01451 family)
MAVAGTLTIIKIANTYTQGPGQQIDFTICIINATGAPVAIRDIMDTLPNSWQWANQTCDVSGNPNLACSPPGTINGGTFAWGHQTLGMPLIMNPNDTINLRIHGSYQASGTQQCNGPPDPNGIGYKVTLMDNTVLTGSSACINVQ